MRAITLTQPWATLVALGAKRIEPRSWKTSYRGPLAIHSAKRFPKAARQFTVDPAPGRYAWILDKVKPLQQPFEAKGKLGLWRLASCYLCGSVEEIGAFGPSSEWLCYQCGMKDEQETLKRVTQDMRRRMERGA